jgi:hypothetical protein
MIQFKIGSDYSSICVAGLRKPRKPESEQLVSRIWILTRTEENTVQVQEKQSNF